MQPTLVKGLRLPGWQHSITTCQTGGPHEEAFSLLQIKAYCVKADIQFVDTRCSLKGRNAASISAEHLLARATYVDRMQKETEGNPGGLQQWQLGWLNPKSFVLLVVCQQQL